MIIEMKKTPSMIPIIAKITITTTRSMIKMPAASGIAPTPKHASQKESEGVRQSSTLIKKLRTAAAAAAATAVDPVAVAVAGIAVVVSSTVCITAAVATAAAVAATWGRTSLVIKVIVVATAAAVAATGIAAALLLLWKHSFVADAG
jgi:hypothetical protein